MTTNRHHPQRLTSAAPLGSLLKRLHIASVHHKLERAKELAGRDEAYLAQIRQLPCIKCGVEPCEAAHVRMNSGAFNKRGGMGKKPADRWSLPLCGGPRGCHAEQHKIGELQFWHDVGLSPLLLCVRLYAAKGDIVKMRAVVFAAIGERG